MPDKGAPVMATLADIQSKPSTPAREKATANIRAALTKMDQPKLGWERTFYDRERLMRIADDGKRSDRDQPRAKEILAGDSRFIDHDPN